jgi:NDP-sugar pyrophosphorylase family protein
MRGGIIAAGHGDRLGRAGFGVPKPLVGVAGRPLIERTLDAFRAAGVSQVACIVNEESGAVVAAHCRERVRDIALTFVHRTTPSSMESLFTLAPLLCEPASTDPFLVMSVDAIIAPQAVRDFATAAIARSDADGVLALTTFVDDEKPVRVQCAADGRITALGSVVQIKGSATVTAGFYVFRPSIFAEVAAARAARFMALRELLAHLVAHGYRLYGERVPKCIDVDRPEDLAAAEAFVRGGYVE